MSYYLITLHILYIFHKLNCKFSHGVMVKVMDCRIVVRGFELQSRYYVHFRASTLGKGVNLFILPAMS